MTNNCVNVFLVPKISNILEFPLNMVENNCHMEEKRFKEIISGLRRT